MKFLILASYSAEGARGVLKGRSGKDRKQMTETMINDLGGKMESYYYSTECDAYVTCQLPSAAAAAAIALAIKASGMGAVTTTLLLDAEEIDQSANLAVNYRHPGN